MDRPTLIALIIAVVLAVTAGLLAFRAARTNRRLARMVSREGERRENQLSELSRSLAATAAQSAELSRSLASQMESLREQNDRKLDGINATVNEKLDQKLQGSFRLVTSQLSDLSKELGELRSLSGGVADLRRMLVGTNSRGAWGEFRLRTLIENTLSPAQYIENAAMDPATTQRVEFAIRLPARDGEALLPVDSKFPQADYLRLVRAGEEGNEVSRQAAGQTLERTIRESAKEIRDKYIRPPKTTDFAVMFLPTESLYAEAARRAGLMEDLQAKYSVILSGPSTFSALLMSLEMGFRTRNLEKKSGDILLSLARIRDEYGKLEELIARMGQRLAQSDEVFEQLDSRSKKLRRALSRIEDGPET